MVDVNTYCHACQPKCLYCAYVLTSDTVIRAIVVTVIWRLMQGSCPGATSSQWPGVDTNLTQLGRVYYFPFGAVPLAISRCFTHSTLSETLTPAYTHTSGLWLPAFYSASKTLKQKKPHTCLPQPHGDYCQQWPTDRYHAYEVY
jgi:hypothetical protein